MRSVIKIDILKCTAVVILEYYDQIYLSSDSIRYTFDVVAKYKFIVVNRT